MSNYLQTEKPVANYSQILQIASPLTQVIQNYLHAKKEAKDLGIAVVKKEAAREIVYQNTEKIPLLLQPVIKQDTALGEEIIRMSDSVFEVEYSGTIGKIATYKSKSSYIQPENSIDTQLTVCHTVSWEGKYGNETLTKLILESIKEQTYARIKSTFGGYKVLKSNF